MFIGLVTNIVIKITEKKIIPFANKIAARNSQFTVLKSNLANDKNISEGKAKVPTNVPMPLDSVCVTTLKRPAVYL